MIYDGKTYRNLESQVGYLTDVAEALDARITEVAANIPSKMIVEELPEEGDPNITYYVGPKGTEPNLYYEVWVWVQEVQDGPFVWRELEDTDQVDLSGYLPKNTASTTYIQVYAKLPNGNQDMYNLATARIGGAVPLRDSYGDIWVPNTPTTEEAATSKKYVVDNFVAKQTGTTTYSQLYGKHADGGQIMFDVTEDNIASTVVKRTTGNQINTALTPVNPNHATSKDYVDGKFLAKQTGTSSYGQVYGKTTSGTQTMWNVNGNPVSDSIPLRFAYGHIKLPNETTYPPTDDDYAVSKRYVDQVVGQLLYLHDLELTILVDADTSTYLKVKASLINGSPTAITSLTTDNFKRMDVQYGQIGSSACSVTKQPTDFVYGDFDDPRPGFMYRYILSDNTEVKGRTTNDMTTTVTDTVISW